MFTVIRFVIPRVLMKVKGGDLLIIKINFIFYYYNLFWFLMAGLIPGPHTC
jgi:hypothetical protein